MNVLDIFIIVPLVYGLVRGFMRGFVFEVISSVALLAALFIATKGTNYFNEYLVSQKIISEKLSYIWAFVLLVVLLLAFIYLIGKLLEQVLKAAQLDVVNRILGALLGGLKLTLVCLILLHYLEKMDRSFQVIKPETKNESLLYIKMLTIKEQARSWIWD